MIGSTPTPRRLGERSASHEFIEYSRAYCRIQTIANHLNPAACSSPSSSPAASNMALVPRPGSANYFSWMSVLLQHPSTLGDFLQRWFCNNSSCLPGNDGGGASAQRRVHVIAAHLSASPVFLDVS